jgi:hypothetical protein
LRLHRAVPTQGLPRQDGQCNTLIETQALLTLPIVRAFAAHATSPSADFCCVVRAPRGALSRDSATHSRSPVISSTAFHARPPDLPPAPLMDMGFAITCSLARQRRPLHPVLVHRPARLLHASFRPHLTVTPLRFAITSPPSGCEEDFHLQAVEHARRTGKKRAFLCLGGTHAALPASILWVVEVCTSNVRTAGSP